MPPKKKKYTDEEEDEENIKNYRDEDSEELEY